MELLSPAGYFGCVKAAICGGADAVYLGTQELPHMRSQGQSFNLTLSELTRAIQLCHSQGKCVYYTLNAPYSDRQINLIRKHLALLGNLELDGIIVADLGLIRLLRRNLPDVKLIASAQMGISNVDSARFIESMGVKRVILDRHITINDATLIKARTQLEVEIFAFGMQCLSHDALCYMGQYFTGAACENTCMSRWISPSGKCRLTYLKFYSVLRYIPKLIEAKIDGIKIEGRNRSASYVRRVTAVFREAIDTCMTDKSYDIRPRWEKILSRCALYEEVTDGTFVDGQPSRQHITKIFKMRSRSAYALELARILTATKSLKPVMHEIRSAFRIDRG